MSSRSASISNIFCGPRGGRLPVWLGVRRPGTWAAATATSAGMRKPGGATSVFWPTSRFPILPWVAVPHLASHILSRIAQRLSQDWERAYGYPIYFLETFVDPERFRGTCYRAANWVLLGRTTGRGKDDQTHRPNRSIKEVLGYPLTARFRELRQGVEACGLRSQRAPRGWMSRSRNWRHGWSGLGRRWAQRAMKNCAPRSARWVM